ISTTIYRLTAHPLAKYPGLFFWRISQAPSARSAWTGDKHLKLLEAHKKHGSVVRVTPDTLCFNTETALRTIYGSRTINNIKSQYYVLQQQPPGNPSLFSETDKDRHARLRRVMANGFSERAIRSAEVHVLQTLPALRQFIDKRCEDGSWSSAIDMADLAAYYTFEVMGRTTFGKQFGMLEKEDERYMKNIIIGNGRYINAVACYPFILSEWLLTHNIFSYLPGKFAQLANESKIFESYCAKHVTERLSSTTAEKEDTKTSADFFTYVQNFKDPETGKGLSDKELASGAMLLIVAGADTSTTTLAALFFYLLHNPHTLERATAEVRSAFSNASEISNGPAFASLTYMNACIEEALRRSPPVPGILPRVALSGGMTVDNQFIPEGINVGVSAFAIHHNPEYYPDPFTYRPERWIAGSSPDATAESVAVAKRAFCPFGIGSRGCLGKGFAYLELRLAVATILFNYDVRLDPEDSMRGAGRKEWDAEGRGRENEYQLQDCFISDRDGPIIQFRRRQ
ncbi:benzoate 4-monooxygenase cytochrome P450, partial [Rhizodiscina lignyota]